MFGSSEAHVQAILAMGWDMPGIYLGNIDKCRVPCTASWNWSISQAKPNQTKLSQAKPSQTKPSQTQRKAQPSQSPFFFNTLRLFYPKGCWVYSTIFWVRFGSFRSSIWKASGISWVPFERTSQDKPKQAKPSQTKPSLFFLIRSAFSIRKASEGIRKASGFYF